MSRSSSNGQPLEQCERADGPQIKRKRSTTNCHQCHRSGKGLVSQCSNCNKRHCIPCVDKWYSKSKGVLFMEACPLCLKFCNCGACLQKKGQSEVLQIQDLNIFHEEKTNFLAYIISVLLPSLKKQVEEAETQDNKVLELLVRAESVVRLYESTDRKQALQTSCSCSTRDAGGKFFMKRLQEMGLKSENYLYSIMAADIEKSDPHFLTHFSNGQPIIVRGVMTGLFDLSWEPGVMERIIRSSLLKASDSMDLSVINCANWCEEKIKIHDFFRGYSKGMLDYQGNPKVLKLEWHPSDMFQKHLPRHYEELSRCLPFKLYTHPMSGCLSDVSMCVSYGPHGGADQWGSIIKLQYGMSDRVFTAINLLLNDLKLN